MIFSRGKLPETTLLLSAILFLHVKARLLTSQEGTTQGVRIKTRKMTRKTNELLADCLLYRHLLWQLIRKT